MRLSDAQENWIYVLSTEDFYSNDWVRAVAHVVTGMIVGNNREQILEKQLQGMKSQFIGVKEWQDLNTLQAEINNGTMQDVDMSFFDDFR